MDVPRWIATPYNGSHGRGPWLSVFSAMPFASSWVQALTAIPTISIAAKLKHKLLAFTEPRFSGRTDILIPAKYIPRVCPGEPVDFEARRLSQTPRLRQAAPKIAPVTHD